LREIIDSAVQANPRLPEEIKINVKERASLVSKIEEVKEPGKANGNTDVSGMFPGEYTLLIVYMKGDTAALRRSQKVFEFLKVKKFDCEKDCKGFDWFIRCI
jgi:hypothetical protein